MDLLSHSQHNIISFDLFQNGDQGTDGPAEPGPLPALQHPAPAHPGPQRSAPPHPLLHDHPRVWLACHCGRPHLHPELSQREHQVPGQGLPLLGSQPPPLLGWQTALGEEMNTLIFTYKSANCHYVGYYFLPEWCVPTLNLCAFISISLIFSLMFTRRLSIL